MTPNDDGLGLALFDEQFIQNPHLLYEQMHPAGHVHRIGDSGFYAVSSWEAVNEAIARPDDFSSNLTATMMYQPGGEVAAFDIGGLGGPTQRWRPPTNPRTRCTKALLPQLAAKRIRAFQPFIAETAEQLWNAQTRSTGASNG